MGTRGLVGTIRNGVLKGSYQQYDSYPTGTGADLQKELRQALDEDDRVSEPEDLFDLFAPLVDKMIYVEADSKPTKEQFETYAGSFDPKVSTGDDWYALLRGNHNSLVKKLRTGVMTDDTDFLKDSLFCEWAYVFDFDTRKVLILRGFNNDPSKQWEHCTLTAAEEEEQKAKAAKIGSSPYYGCTLIATLSMAEFLAMDMKAFEGSLNEGDGEAA